MKMMKKHDRNFYIFKKELNEKILREKEAVTRDDERCVWGQMESRDFITKKRRRRCEKFN
jgi:hypothetical protein